MSLHNEWVSQYHKILKVLFLNFCSSQNVWSRARNECGSCGWSVPTVTHASGETHSPVVWWMRALGLDVGNVPSLPSSDVGLFYNCTNHITFYSTYWNCKAQNITDTEVPRYLRRSELCGLVLLLGICVVLVCWSISGSCCPPFHPLCQWLGELVVGSTLNSLSCFALQLQ